MALYGDVPAIWYKAYWMIFSYLDKYIPADNCHDAAAKACGLWFQNAADGKETIHGAYQSLYAAAQYVLIERGRTQLLDASTELDDRIPLEDTRLACDLARLYAGIWQAGALNGWDRKTIHKISKRVGRMCPTDDDSWRDLDPVAIDDEVARLGRQAAKTMHDHSCVGNDVCTQSALIWEREDQVSAQWMTDERLAREGI